MSGPLHAADETEAYKNWLNVKTSAFAGLQPYGKYKACLTCCFQLASPQWIRCCDAHGGVSQAAATLSLFMYSSRTWSGHMRQAAGSKAW